LRAIVPTGWGENEKKLQSLNILVERPALWQQLRSDRSLVETVKGKVREDS
jgi:hypothetical protein